MLIRQLFSLLVLLAVTVPVAAQPASLVSVDTVTTNEVAQTVTANGRLVAIQQGSIAARIGGSVAEINVVIGDSVKQGQIMAKLDTAQLALRQQLATVQLEEAKARLATAKQRARLAEREVERLNSLNDATTVSRATLENAQQQALIAQAQVVEAQTSIRRSQVALQLAQLDLSYAEIIAPYDATVAQKNTEVGSYLQTGQSVFELVHDQNLEVDADLPGNSVAHINRGDVAIVQLDSGAQYQVTMRAVVPLENVRTRTRQVRFSFLPGQDTRALVSGQGLTIRVPASKAENRLTVSKDGVTETPNGKIAFVVVDGKAQPRPVKTGDAIGTRLVITSGLQQGDQVVVRGNERLAPGQSVTIIP